MQFVPETEVHPIHELKLFPPAVAGAPKIIVVPELSVTVKVVIPLARRLVSEFPYEMLTPLAGFEL